MTQLARPLLAAIAVLGIAGCSGGTSADPDPSKQPESALANLDTCDIMTPQQLQQGGFEFTERIKQLDFERGCGFDSDQLSLGIYKNESPPKALKENRDWGEFAPLNVNGRNGARATSPTGEGNSCWTLIPAGGGTVLVYTLPGDPRQPMDSCAESLKIAKQIEPNLPE